MQRIDFRKVYKALKEMQKLGKDVPGMNELYLIAAEEVDNIRDAIDARRKAIREATESLYTDTGQ